MIEMAQRQKPMANDPKGHDQPPVLQNVSRLESSLARLRELQQAFISRCSPVCSPEPPANKGESLPPKPHGSPLAGHIDSMNDYVLCLCNDIDEALGRLEI